MLSVLFMKTGVVIDNINILELDVPGISRQSSHFHVYLSGSSHTTLEVRGCSEFSESK